MDHDSSTRQGVHCLSKGGEIVGAILWSVATSAALWLKIWIDSQPRSSRARFSWQIHRRGDMRSNQHATSEDPAFQISPSPTGALHIGGAGRHSATGLRARHEGGSLGVRIEDTDHERSSGGKRRADPRRAALAGSWTRTRGLSRRASRPSVTQVALERLLESGARLSRLRHREGRRGLEGRARRRVVAIRGEPRRRRTPRWGCGCPTRARPWSRT